MKLSCKKTYDLDLFSPKRLTFKVEKPEGKEAKEQAPEKAEAQLSLKEKYEKNKDALAKGVEVDASVRKTAEKLAKKIDGEKKTADEISLALIEALKKNDINEADWKASVEQDKIDFLRIVNKGGEWVFEGVKRDGKTESIATFGSASKIPVDVPPEKKETPPGKPGEMRMIDEMAEAAEKERIENEEKGEVVRERVFRNKDDVSGKLRPSKENQKEIGAVYIKIDKIYPDARKGDIVTITDYNGAKKKAEYDGQSFKYIQPKSLKGKEAKARWGYEVELDAVSREAEKPKPTDYPNAGYFRVKENMSWKALAKKIMRTPDIPKGRDINEGPAGVQKGNAAARIRKLGYDYNKPADVAAYAEILRKGNTPPHCNDKLHVYLVIPKGENPRLKAERKKAREKEQEKKARKEAGEQFIRQEETVRKVTAKHFSKLWDIDDYKVDEKFADVVRDKKLFLKYWAEGRFKPKAAVDRIKQGFRRLGVPADKVARITWNAVYQGDADYTDLEDLMDASIDFKAPIYKDFKGNTDHKTPSAHFKNEYKFFWIASRIEQGKPVSEAQRENYEDNKDTFLIGQHKNNAAGRLHELRTIMQGAALIMDGISRLKVGKNIKVSKDELEHRERGQERRDLRTKGSFNRMRDDEDFKVKPEMEAFTHDGEKFLKYWKERRFAGQARVEKGLSGLGVPKSKQGKFLLDALQGAGMLNKNEYIDFGDLLGELDDYQVNAFVTKDRERGGIDEFWNEYKFYQIATYKKKGRKLSKGQKEFYNSNREEYINEAKVGDVEKRYQYLANILRNATMVLDGTEQLEPTNLKIKEDASLERTPWNAKTQEEKFLQQFFHPKNTKSLEEIVGAEELEEGSEFQTRYSEETAYQMIKLQSADPENPQKMNRDIMVNLMNGMIRTALADFFNLRQVVLNARKEGKEKPQLTSELEKRSLRFFGTKNWEKINLPGSGSEIQRAEKKYFLGKNLAIGDSFLVEQQRNLLQSGFLTQREIADGEVKLHDKIPGMKEWVHYSDILENVETEAAKEIWRELMQQPKFRELSKEEMKKAVEDIDAFMKKEHQYTGEGIEGRSIDSLKKTKDNRLFDVNAGVDVNSGDWYLGLSKEIVKIPGIDVSLRMGIAVNPKTGEILIGATLGKKVELSKQWSMSIGGGVGVEVTRPRVIAGVELGFTWMSKGSEDSPWRETITPAVGAGAHLAVNPADIALGPYFSFEVGQKKDVAEQSRLLYTNAYLKNRLDMVDAAVGEKEKAQAIMRLPRGVGELMIETKFNLNWTDRQLVEFFENNIKGALDKMAMEKAFDGLQPLSISEWGIGGKVDVVKLAALVATGGLAAAIFIRAGIVVSSTIKVERRLDDSVSQQQIAMERRAVEKLNQMAPNVKITYEVLSYKDMENVNSRNFAGSALERMVGGAPSLKPASVEKSEFNPEKTANFAELKTEFAKHGLLLSYDKKEQMYSIEPTMTQTYRMYIDDSIAKGHGLVMKGRKILIAAKEDMSNLHIRRFDVFYPGYVEGANQHTVITITDNPYVKMEVLEEQGSYIEVKYDRSRDIKESPTKVGSQRNIYTLAEYKKAKGLLKATVRTETAKMSEAEQKQRAEAMGLTIEAFKQAQGLQENIDLSNLPMSPEKFSKNWRYQMLYRKLTTIPPGGTEKDFEKLDTAIKKENPDITGDQLILYKERLFSLSMSEQRMATREATIKRRLQWARNAVFVPFFKRKMAEKPGLVPPGIDAGDLADAFLNAVGNRLKGKPQELDPGQALFTSVGTMYVNGIRMVQAASGQNNENNSFTEAIDYSKFLASTGAEATKEHRIIAQLLLSEHAEIPKENTAFLKSRLAKKLFYMGKDGVPNPLVEAIGKNKFKQLIEAYKAIESGGEAPASSTEGIQALREIAEKLQNAQVDGLPTVIDGNRPARAVQIGEFLFVIETTLKSGIYEYCKNPSVLYNEQIGVYRMPEVQKQVQEMRAQVASGAGAPVVLESRTAEIWSIGLNAIGKFEIKSQVRQEATPPPPEPPDEKIPPPPPAPRPKPAPGVGQTGGKTEGGSTEGPGETDEGSAGL